MVSPSSQHHQLVFSDHAGCSTGQRVKKYPDFLFGQSLNTVFQLLRTSIIFLETLFSLLPLYGQSVEVCRNERLSLHPFTSPVRNMHATLAFEM